MATLLTTGAEELFGVLEHLALHPPGEHCTGQEFATVLGHDQADESIWNDGEWLEGDFILPNPFPEVEAGSESLRLEARFAIECDDSAAG